MPTLDKNKLRLWSYDFNSESGKLLAEQMGILRIKHEGSMFTGNRTHTVVNWGSSPKTFGVKGYSFGVLNNPNAVELCINKIKFFETCSKVIGSSKAPNIPDWTTNKEQAKIWLQEGDCVIARQKVEGMAGDGIVVMNNPEDIVDAKLYTRYIPKSLEFRIYIVAGKMVDFAQKMRKTDEEPKNWKIRSRDNGFVYVFKEPTVLPDVCVQEALKANDCVGLDFSGVDVVYGSRDKKAYVLEVNSAPWLYQQTAKKMSEALLKAIGG